MGSSQGERTAEENEEEVESTQDYKMAENDFIDLLRKYDEKELNDFGDLSILAGGIIDVDSNDEHFQIIQERTRSRSLPHALPSTRQVSGHDLTWVPSKPGFGLLGWLVRFERG
jgi:hypothetical protein